MNESTKRIIDWLTVPILGMPAAIILFDYISNTHPSKILVVLLMLDTPFAAAAFIWLGWRFFNIMLREERTKRIIDSLALIPLGYIPFMLIWFHNTHPTGIWSVLLVVDLPLFIASIFWLVFRHVK